MSDSFYGAIRIGGPIRRGDLKGLADAIRNEEMQDAGYNRVQIERPEDFKKYLYQGTLRFCDPEARCGYFFTLEEWLRGRGIPYDRFSEGFGEFNAVRVFYRPGMEEVLDRYCSNDGKELVLREEAARLLKFRKPETIYRHLRETLGPHVPELPRIDSTIFATKKRRRKGA